MYYKLRVYASLKCKISISGSWCLATLKDDYGSSPDRPLFRPIELEEIDDDESDELLHQPEKKRRLTAEQVQFLEKSFEFENKLEPERKLRIAKFLGLKPRQIAIWFQNRRARWKTKQLEKDYEALKSSYHTLKMDHGRLLKEKEELEIEVLTLHSCLRCLSYSKYLSDVKTNILEFNENLR